MNLQCEECGKPYKKSAKFKSYIKKGANRDKYNFKWPLRFCDKCRSAKEAAIANKLPDMFK